MPPFRRVLGERAGPHAVGILVPPGQRTVLVVRPRALQWDLLLTQRGENGGSGPVIRELTRHDAASVAQQLSKALIEEAAKRRCHTATMLNSSGERFHVWVGVDPFPLLVCERHPGQAYRAAEFATVEEAEEAAGVIQAALLPEPDANWELYTNTHYFSRP